MKIKNRKNTRRNLIVATLLALLILGGVILWAFSNKIWPFNNKIDTTEIRDTNSVDYGPPSETDIDESQNAKEQIIQEDEDSSASKGESPSDAPKQKVSVGIANTYKAETNFEIRAFTPDVIEGDGVCTATLNRNGLTVTAQSKAFIDASTSQCQPILIPLSNFKEPGIWNLTVSYESSKYKGVSSRMEVEL